MNRVDMKLLHLLFTEGTNAGRRHRMFDFNRAISGPTRLLAVLFPGTSGKMVGVCPIAKLVESQSTCIGALKL